MTAFLFMAVFELATALLCALAGRHFRRRAADLFADGHAQSAERYWLLARLWGAGPWLLMMAAGATLALDLGRGW
jgi:hypothetical protein